MIGGTVHPRSLFYPPWVADLDRLTDPVLERIDRILDDPRLVEAVGSALAHRAPRSKTTGRPGISPDRLLRCCVLKHIKRWSFRQLEAELRPNLLYRRFTRFNHEAIPDYSTFSRTFALLDDDTLRKVHDRVVGEARQRGVAPGRKLRTDTTVVETNVHYPSDSSLLEDGIRVLGRSLRYLAGACAEGAVKVVDHTRATTRRVLEIERAARSRVEEAGEKLKGSYRKLLGLARGVVHRAEKACGDLAAGAVRVHDVLVAEAECKVMEHFLPLVKRVIGQTRARLFKGDTRHPDKVLSLFEEHTQVIRKGKPAKPTEFGRLVRIDEVENGIVSDFAIEDGNPADQGQLVPAVQAHCRRYGEAPELVAADRGFASGPNEAKVIAAGVKQVAVPRPGRLSAARAAIQKQRWFRRALRWRVGIEGRIAILKHGFGMVRAFYKGDRGFKRHVALSVVVNNLVAIAKAGLRREAKRRPAGIAPQGPRETASP